MTASQLRLKAVAAEMQAECEYNESLSPRVSKANWQMNHGFKSEKTSNGSREFQNKVAPVFNI